MKKLLTIFFIVMMSLFASLAHAHPYAEDKDNPRLMEVKHLQYTLWVNCSERAAEKFYYLATKDTGDYPREKKFTFDPNVPRDCQQTSTKTYGRGFDLGHQAPANHFDSNKVAEHESNYITNVLPQTKELNRKGWLHSEMIIQCLRAEGDLDVYGGVIWGNNTDNDLFVKTHGIRTPDKFYKIIIDRTHKRSIAWIMPNDSTVGEAIDQYIVSIKDINNATGENYTDPTNPDLTHKEKTSWLAQKGCKRD